MKLLGTSEAWPAPPTAAPPSTQFHCGTSPTGSSHWPARSPTARRRASTWTTARAPSTAGPRTACTPPARFTGTTYSTPRNPRRPSPAASGMSPATTLPLPHHSPVSPWIAQPPTPSPRRTVCKPAQRRTLTAPPGVALHCSLHCAIPFTLHILPSKSGHSTGTQCHPSDPYPRGYAAY